MLRRPPRPTRLTPSFPTRRSSDLNTSSTPSGCTSIASIAVANTPPLALFEGPFTPGQQTSPALTSTESGGTGGVGIQLLLLPSDIDITQLQPTFIADSRSEEHTSELQTLMRLSYAVFCLTKKT